MSIYIYIAHPYTIRIAGGWNYIIIISLHLYLLRIYANFVTELQVHQQAENKRRNLPTQSFYL